MHLAQPPPNRCKKLTTRRLLARRPSGRLSQSALHGGALSAKPVSSRRKKRAAVSVTREAALQLMRQSLGGPTYSSVIHASLVQRTIPLRPTMIRLDANSEFGIALSNHIIPPFGHAGLSA